jgi:hypothetical protein
MNPDFKDLLRLFNENNVDYLVVGGYAVIFYTEPRYTKDLDVWIWTTPENAKRVFRSLAQFGAPLAGLTSADFEEAGSVFQIGVAPVRIDVLMSVDGLTFDACWKNRVVVDFDGISVAIPTCADLIRNKRASGRPQDLIDATNLERSLETFGEP